jgi:hypothetical protein
MLGRGQPALLEHLVLSNARTPSRCRGQLGPTREVSGGTYRTRTPVQRASARMQQQRPPVRGQAAHGLRPLDPTRRHPAGTRRDRVPCLRSEGVLQRQVDPS